MREEIGYNLTNVIIFVRFKEQVKEKHDDDKPQGNGQIETTNNSQELKREPSQEETSPEKSVQTTVPQNKTDIAVHSCKIILRNRALQ